MTYKEAVEELRRYQNIKFGARVGIERNDLNQIVGALNEHEQKAECYDRAVELLKAAESLLKKQVGAYYVLNLLEETVEYDNAECDGACLLEDIKYLWEEMRDVRGTD